MSEELRNLEITRRWADFYNNDVERMVRDIYTKDCVVYTMGFGSIRGWDQFVEVEQGVLKVAPKRKLRIDHHHAKANVVVAEGVLLDADRGAKWELPFVAVLNFRDGRIFEDRSYADWKSWPGLVVS